MPAGRYQPISSPLKSNHLVRSFVSSTSSMPLTDCSGVIRPSNPVIRVLTQPERPGGCRGMCTSVTDGSLHDPSGQTTGKRARKQGKGKSTTTTSSSSSGSPLNHHHQQQQQQQSSQPPPAAAAVLSTTTSSSSSPLNHQQRQSVRTWVQEGDGDALGLQVDGEAACHHVEGALAGPIGVAACDCTRVSGREGRVLPTSCR